MCLAGGVGMLFQIVKTRPERPGAYLEQYAYPTRESPYPTQRSRSPARRLDKIDNPY